LDQEQEDKEEMDKVDISCGYKAPSKFKPARCPGSDAQYLEILEKPNPLKLEIMDRRFDGKGNFWLKIYFAFSHNFSKENLQTSPTKFYSVFCEILGKIL
jgi:hypothetical protein